jgi:YihY family inner membrane protein
MSTANTVPETWELNGVDARKVLAQTGRGRLLREAFRRMRAADGFSHARAMAFVGTLVILQAVIAAVGFARALGAGQLRDSILHTLQFVVPGPAGKVLTQAGGQATAAGTSSHYWALTLGAIGALITGTILAGQVERAMNRLYGIEKDRPSFAKYRHALFISLSSGLLFLIAFVILALGNAVGGSGGSDASNPGMWSLVRWPIGVLLLVVATAVLFRWAPRRRQPSWSWLLFGSAVSVAGLAAATLGLDLFFRLSATFDKTYGPLAGIVALMLWASLAAIALLYGAAAAAQLEAVRAGRADPLRQPPVSGVQRDGFPPRRM